MNGPAAKGVKRSKYILITGGAGFVGTNLADRLLEEGNRVLIYDNLSRAGVEKNLSWLKRKHRGLLQAEVADVRDAGALAQAVKKASAVFHLASQVAVTTSLQDPAADFEINARGTINLLEAVRACKDFPPVVFTSTNKVYGECAEIKLGNNFFRYSPEDPSIREFGIPESRPLDFHSPYGCSKGAADQYVLDYARTFGLRNTVFRMSCIYGPHQFGTEDQGWVAHFLISAIEGRPITIYGDGMQVRDVLFAGDLVDAFMRVLEDPDRFSGEAFNIGGGPKNALSLLDLIDIISKLDHGKPFVRYKAWRAGDQCYFVSDTRKFERHAGWRPKTAMDEGIHILYSWLLANRKHGQRRLAVQAAS